MDEIPPAAVAELKALLGDRVLTEPGALAAYGRDATPLFRHAPDVVVQPLSTEETAGVLRIATRHRVPVTTRGAGTNLCAATVPLSGGIVLSTTRMTALLEVSRDEMLAVCQPGVTAGALNRAAAAEGLVYVPDPGSKEASTVGGNVATCAGGLRGLKYGVTRQYVLGLEAVLPDGEVIRTGGRLVKDVAGYDLTRLLVGSEGTLAVITEITMALVPNPAAARYGVAYFETMTDASEAVRDIVASGPAPATLEFMDAVCVAAVEDFAHLGLRLDAGALPLFGDDGEPDAVDRSLARMAEVCAKRATHIELAESVAAAEDLLAARRCNLRKAGIVSEQTGPGRSSGIFTKNLLDACISCGFCLPACPTYALTGQEQSSPRGRITLMRMLETGELPADDSTLAEESSLCLGCRACETVCPAGVQYGHLLEEWRDEQWSGLKRPWIVRPLLLVANRKWVLRLLGLVRRSARKRSASARAVASAPKAAATASAGVGAGGLGAAGAEQPSLMLGCFERALFPSVSRNLAALDPALGVDPNQGCCGALHAHNGALEQGRDLARKLGEQLPGTIVTTSGGCAAHLADVIGRDRVVEASEWLLKQNPDTSRRPLRVGIQDSCHLRNGLGVWKEPRELLDRTATYVELPSAGSCCGAAGTYALVRKKESKAILAKKIAEIEAADLDLVIAVNPGCLRQLQTGLRKAKSRTKAVHVVDYLQGR